MISCRSIIPVHDARADATHPTYRADIDGLRAVAVLAVVGFHAFPERVPGGFVGVDIFFVISGFLISTILFKSLERNTFSFGDFYARRIRRIFPALGVTLAAVLAFGALALTPAEYAQLGRHAAAGAAFVANFSIHAESGYFDGAADTKPLLHLWSLGIEEQFYVVWPFVLWLSTRAGLSPVIAVAVIGLGSFAANVASVHAQPRDAFYFPHTRVWELMLGAALAYVTLRGSASKWRSPAVANALSTAGVAAIALALALVNEASAFPGWWALLPTIGAGLLIHAGPQAWLNRVLLSSPPMVWVGLISYPLYLWHWPLLVYARILVNPEGSAAIDPSRAIRIALVALAFVLSWATYKLVEQPIRTGPARRARVAWLAASMVVIAAAGWDSYSRGGYPGRLGPTRETFYAPSRMALEAYQSHPAYPAVFRGASPIEGRDIFLSQPSTAEDFDVAFVGDSHAWILYDGFARASRQRAIVIGRGTCPPFFDVDGLRRDITVETPLLCQPLVNNALDTFSRDPLTKVIVLTAFFDQYGRGVRLTAGGRPGVEIQDALRETLLRLGRTGKHVVVALDVPEIPRSCYRRRFPVWAAQAPGECTVARETFEANRRPLVDVVREVSQAMPNVSAYDPAAVLCDQDRCGEIDAGHTLYITDGNHLNTYGAERLGRDFAQFVERLLHSP